MIPENRDPVHPGEILQYEFLEPLGTSPDVLANHIGVGIGEIDALLREESPVTARLAWLLGMATGTGPELWMDLQTKYADGRFTAIDGLRVDWPDRWFHVRVSQTEPIVRVICEQRGEPPTALFDALMDQVRSLA